MVTHRKKQDIRSDLCSVMGCLLVMGHLLTAGHPLCRTLSAKIHLFPSPQMLISTTSSAERAWPRAGTWEEDTAQGHSVMLPLGSLSSPPCARVCCLHEAWRQLRELCRFPVLCFEFLLGNINCTCLVFSLWPPAWCQRWTETVLGLFGCFGKIPDAGIKCLPRHAAKGRLTHTGPAASSRGAMSPAGPQNVASVCHDNGTNGWTTPAWINRTSGVTCDGGSEELPVSLQSLC